MQRDVAGAEIDSVEHRPSRVDAVDRGEQVVRQVQEKTRAAAEVEHAPVRRRAGCERLEAAAHLRLVLGAEMRLGLVVLAGEL